MSYSLNGWVDGLVGADFEVDFEEGGGGGFGMLLWGFFGGDERSF